MSKTNLVKKILVSLDSLLDFRLGTLIKLSPEFAYQVSNDKAFYTREEDTFSSVEMGHLPKDIFNEIYMLYKEEIIRSSIMTKFFIFLKQLTQEMINKAISTPYYGEIEVEVNVYPHKFTNQEGDDLVKAISFHLGELVSTSIVSIPPEQLTPSYILNDYYALAMYDPKPWLDTHHRELQKGTLKDIVLYTPRLNHIRKLEDTEIAKLNKENMDLFNIFTMLLSPFICIQFLPISLFSAETAANKKEYFM